MGKLPILSKPPLEDAAVPVHPPTAALPIAYMGDYSVMGLVVSECARAIAVLKQQAVSVTSAPSGSVVHFTDAAALTAILQILRAHAIECNISDVVSHVYQG